MFVNSNEQGFENEETRSDPQTSDNLCQLNQVILRPPITRSISTSYLIRSNDHVHEIELVHRTRHVMRRSGRLSTTWQRGWRLTSTSLPRPHYELLCCAGDYGGAAGSIEDLGSPGVSPLPAYYEQNPIASSGTVQKGRPRKRKLSEVTGSELPVTMRLAAGALGESSQCMFRDLVRSWTIFI